MNVAFCPDVLLRPIHTLLSFEIVESSTNLPVSILTLLTEKVVSSAESFGKICGESSSNCVFIGTQVYVLQDSPKVCQL